MPRLSRISAACLLHARAVDPSPAAEGLPAEEDVLGNGEERHQVDLLVHRGDPEPLGILSGGDRDALPVDVYVASIGLVHTAQDLDQRRFAGAVLTDERVDLPSA